MKYWPINAIAHSPLLPAPYMVEALNFYYQLPSEAAVGAMLAVARQTQPVDMPNLAIVETEGAPLRRVYTGTPTQDEWLRLERSGVLASSDGELFITIDALH